MRWPDPAGTVRSACSPNPGERLFTPGARQDSPACQVPCKVLNTDLGTAIVIIDCAPGEAVAPGQLRGTPDLVAKGGPRWVRMTDGLHDFPTKTC